MNIRHEATFYNAQRSLNTFMQCADLRGDYKWFVDAVPTSFDVEPHFNPEKFQEVVMRSRELYDKGEVDFWIPAIKYMATFFYHPDVRVLGIDGMEVFITQVEASSDSSTPHFLE